MLGLVFLHVTVLSGKSEESFSTSITEDTSLSSTGMRRNGSSFCTRKRAKNSRALKPSISVFFGYSAKEQSPRKVRGDIWKGNSHVFSQNHRCLPFWTIERNLRTSSEFCGKTYSPSFRCRV
ncbi:hypothetical protein CEXT_135621 [Caerostris extrusa]|uniref:Secreted protein n=1 Tax=Caerostris extrusa TaxID=172846 RepID=A0AAV4QHU1_CAEEX|nr:hypothetical protein CEXT_135621 [Caerostris extrusa]